MADVSVVMPVGPRDGHRKWLGEALKSCATQSLPPEEVILVIDEAADEIEYSPAIALKIREWVAPWPLGAANAWNQGVGLARTSHVFFLASDDTLEPNCLRNCMGELKEAKDSDSTIIWVGVRYMDTGKTQALPCGAMMVPKVLWERIGGYPLECVFGAPDHVLFSCLLKNGASHGIELRGVKAPLYNYRDHPDTDKYHLAKWHGVMAQVRDRLTADWEPKW